MESRGSCFHFTEEETEFQRNLRNLPVASQTYSEALWESCPLPSDLATVPADSSFFMAASSSELDMYILSPQIAADLEAEQKRRAWIQGLHIFCVQKYMAKLLPHTGLGGQDFFLAGELVHPTSMGTSHFL